MILFIGLLLQLLIISVGITHSIPLPAPPDAETHTFRWATCNDLNNTTCAFPSTPWRFPNDTLHPDPNWSKLYEGEILLGAASTPEDNRIICQNKNSLFTLVGNPGIIWHPLSGQCVHIKTVNCKTRDTDENDPVVEVMQKTLITNCACERNKSNVPLFKYDKNKPQRLTFLENDPTTGKKEEWCIRGDGSFIQVMPKSDVDPVTSYEFEPVFHEVL